MPKIWLLHGKGEEESAKIIAERLKALGNSVRTIPSPYDSGEYRMLVKGAIAEFGRTGQKAIPENKSERKAGSILSPEDAAVSILQQTNKLGTQEKERKTNPLLFEASDRYEAAIARIQKKALKKGIFIARIVSSFYIADNASKLPEKGEIPLVHTDAHKLSDAVAGIVLDRKPIAGSDYSGILAYRDGRHPLALTLDLPHYVIDRQSPHNGRFPHFATNVLGVQMEKKQPKSIRQIGASRGYFVEREDLHEKAAKGIHHEAAKFELARRKQFEN
ncbi:MAG: hypothetical protein ABIG96_02575 [Candidatus Micrarchaeota archaeon]